MNTKLYIGIELADFNEVFNVMFSIGDIKEISFGNSNKSYTLDLPLTKTNKKLLKYISQSDVKTEVSVIGRLYLGELCIIQGTIKVLEYSDFSIKILIDSDDWISDLKDIKMTALDLSTHDHLLTSANVENSWAASYPFYRYPMIDFGGLMSGEAGSSANWYPNDFIPMLSISQLITKIFAPRTISSNFLSLAAIKDLFILARETIADNTFIQSGSIEMGVYLITDNEDHLYPHPSHTTNTLTITKEPPIFGDAIINEGGNYSYPNNWYLVPENGTYKFDYTINVYTDHVAPTFNAIVQAFRLYVKKDTGGSVTTIYDSGAKTNFLTTSFKTDYLYLLAGDKIYLRIEASSQAYNNTIEGANVDFYLQTSCRIKLNMANANKYKGINQNVSCEELLPDISQLDFLAAIKDIYNLRFWLDKQRNIIHIEPWDTFISSDIIDLTSFIDFENITTQLISQSYNKNITLKWKNDDSDEAFKEYLKNNLYGPGRKDIILTSLFTNEGTDEREHPWSSVITGYNQSLSNTSTLVPRIWNTEPISPFIMFDRKVGFNTRIVSWKGLTAGFTWYYNGVAKTTYPKIEGLDFNAIYSSYWQKTFHYIDKGKLYIVRMKILPTFLTQFLTVISTATSEGFRPTYKVTIKGIDNYFILQKITSDGETAELELILKL